MEELAIVMNVRLVVDIFLVKRLEICVLMVDVRDVVQKVVLGKVM